MDSPAFVKWIETLLIQNDISKEVFYSESGISTANMTQWRAGDYNPSKRSIEKVERFFESKQKETPTLQMESELDAETIELRGIWDSADEDERRALLEMARLIKSRRNK